MNLLISLCLAKGDITPLIGIPSELLSEAERALVAFIVGYYAEFKKIPTAARVSSEFPYFYPTSVTDLESFVLEDVAAQTRKSKLLRHWEHTLQNAMTIIRESDELPTDAVTELMKLTSVTNGVHTFGGFDRSEYFRSAGLKTGLKMIDVATGGVGKGEVMIITGRLGNKKTTISLFITHAWWHAGKKILFASNEMAPADVYARLDGIVGHFNPMLIRHDSDGETTKRIETVTSAVRVKSRDGGGEIFIPRQRVRTPAEVFALAQHLGADGVVIDGMYLMQPSSGHYTSKWERISEISNEIKAGASDAGLPVVAITQLKRTGGRKDAYDPEDIAYSDSIGQDADFVLVSNPSVLDRNKLELQLIKNRFGAEVATLTSIDFDTMTLTEESVLDGEAADEEFFRKKAGSFVDVRV